VNKNTINPYPQSITRLKKIISISICSESIYKSNTTAANRLGDKLSPTPEDSETSSLVSSNVDLFNSPSERVDIENVDISQLKGIDSFEFRRWKLTVDKDLFSVIVPYKTLSVIKSFSNYNGWEFTTPSSQKMLYLKTKYPKNSSGLEGIVEFRKGAAENMYLLKGKKEYEGGRTKIGAWTYLNSIKKNIFSQGIYRKSEAKTSVGLFSYYPQLGKEDLSCGVIHLSDKGVSSEGKFDYSDVARKVVMINGEVKSQDGSVEHGDFVYSRRLKDIRLTTGS
jgi:hypothetical protein